jgi:UPF0755 protein
MHRSTKIAIAAAVLVFPLYVFIQFFVPAYDNPTPIEVEIPQGTSYAKAVDILADNKLIRDKFLFHTLGRIVGLDKKLRAGYYHFWSRISPFDVFMLLKQGKIIEHDVTVVEGDNLDDIARKLETEDILAAGAFLKASTDRSLLNSMDIKAPSVEGYLYPDTYKLYKGVRPEEVIKLMVGRLRSAYTNEIRERMKKLDLDERQMLTLASIIEKEAAVDKERPLVSAVYHNRLRKGMLLQADPTAIYGVKGSRSKITGSDLRNKTPYNTYIIQGLPPGPIASPGIKSIRASLYPADVPYIFFVSRGDRTHIFSVKLSDHNEAIRLVRSTVPRESEANVAGAKPESMDDPAPQTGKKDETAK